MLATLRNAALAALLIAPVAAAAQVGGSIIAESDDRFRGVSQTNERPNLRLTLSFDHASGVYAGASLSSVSFDPDERRAILLAYGGVTGALSESLRWDAGLTASHFDSDSSYDYTELYAGIGGERWNVRLYLSPDYFGSGAGTLYAEVDATWPLAAAWRLVGHLGGLRRVDGQDGTGFDARLGLVLHAAELDWQLSWVGKQRSGPFVSRYSPRLSRLVLSASYAF